MGHSTSPSSSDKVLERKLYSISAEVLKLKALATICDTIPISAALLPSHYALFEGVPLKRSYDGVLDSCSTPTWDAWEQKSL